MQGDNLSVKAYKEIKEMLISLRFPPGAPLSELELAKMLEMSRTPIREALQRLAHEGWVNLGDKKRTSVSVVTRTDIEELYQLRLLVEPFAASEVLRLGRGRILAALLDDVVCTIAELQGDYGTFARLDTEFHSLVISNAGNERLTRFWLGLLEENARAVNLSLQADDCTRPLRVLDEHTKLVDAFWNRDKDSVLAAIAEHLASSRKVLLSSFGPEEGARDESADPLFGAELAEGNGFCRIRR